MMHQIQDDRDQSATLGGLMYLDLDAAMNSDEFQQGRLVRFAHACDSCHAAGTLVSQQHDAAVQQLTVYHRDGSCPGYVAVRRPMSKPSAS